MNKTITLISLVFAFSVNADTPKLPTLPAKSPPSNEAMPPLPKQSFEKAVQQLNAKDKAILEQIQNQVINWPEGTFKEISAYRSFIINARKQAEEMHNKLSNEAREAVKIEQDLKSQLSSEGMRILNSIEEQR